MSNRIKTSAKLQGVITSSPASCSANHPTCKYCIYAKMPHPPGSWCYMFKTGTHVNRGDKSWCAKYEGMCQGCGMKLTIVVDDLCATCAGRLARRNSPNVESSHAAPSVRHSTGVTD